MGGTRRDDLERVDGGGVLGDLGDERVGEDVLRDGDGEGAAEGIEEDGEGI